MLSAKTDKKLTGKNEELEKHKNPHSSVADIRYTSIRIVINKYVFVCANVFVYI